MSSHHCTSHFQILPPPLKVSYDLLRIDFLKQHLKSPCSLIATFSKCSFHTFPAKVSFSIKTTPRPHFIVYVSLPDLKDVTAFFSLLTVASPTIPSLLTVPDTPRQSCFLWLPPGLHSVCIPYIMWCNIRNCWCNSFKPVNQKVTSNLCSLLMFSLQESGWKQMFF